VHLVLIALLLQTCIPVPVPCQQTAGRCDTILDEGVQTIDRFILNGPHPNPAYALAIRLRGNDNQASCRFATVTVSEGFISNLGVGDFNGDGNADLAVQEQIPGEYTIYETAILLGDGEGSFGGYQATYVGVYNSVAVGDLNGDGKLDVASGQGAEIVALGNGDGTFGTPVPYLTGGDAGYSAIADFNRDGKLDLIAGESGCVSILLGNGDGTFQPGKQFLTAFGWFAVGDFNGDGKPDLAVTDGISKVYILTNTTK
jgi:hypothetical protein